MATNVTFHEVREAIITALMNIAISTPQKVTGMFKKWGELLENFTEDEDDKVDIMFIVQRFFVKKVREGETGRQAFVVGLQGLYQVDVLEEEVIFKWFEDQKAKGVGEKWGEDMLALRNYAEKFVTWLKEAEEENDEE
jgi:transcription termination factor NusB